MLTVPVFPPAAKVSLLAPVPRSTDIAVVSTLPRVMVSLPVPPVMVSVLDTVAVLVKLPKLSVSLPEARSIETSMIAADRVTISASVPPSRVSVLATEIVLPPAASVRVSLPAPRSTDPLAMLVASVIVSTPDATDQGSDIADGARVGGGRQSELVGSGAEVDRHIGGQRRAERDGVVAGAAGDGIGVGNCRAVRAVGEGQRVAAATKVDRAIGDGAAKVMVSAPVPPMRV